MRKAVLIFGHNYATQFIDISNQYTRLFDPAQFEVHVVYLSGPPDEAVRKRHITENIYFLNSPERSTRGLKIFAIRKMRRLQQEKKFQIVICHRYKPSYVMLWVARFTRIPALFFVMHEFNTMRPFTRRWLATVLFQKNMYFAGVSNAVRDDIRRDLKKVPSENIITLYNVIDIELTQPLFLSRQESRRRLHLPEDNFVFGTVGRLAKAKDQRTLIDAFALIKVKCPRAKLVIMGDGALETDLKTQIRASRLENDVMLTGYIDQGFQLIKAFDVFVLCSIKEAFGRVLLESMLAEVPVIATRINGIPEVVSPSDRLVDPANPSQLAAAMLESYRRSSDELTQWGTASRQHVIQNFSIQRFHDIFWKTRLLRTI